MKARRTDGEPGVKRMPAPKLKEIFNVRLVEELAAEVARADGNFDSGGFMRRGIEGLDGLELMGRARHLAETLREYLPQPFARAGEVLIASFGPEIAATGENGLSPLRYMPHVFYVQKYGIDDFEAAMRVQYELTKRFTAEWSIRTFLEKYPERTYAQLEEWAGDGSAHVRRLVSEGTRPRLPWAPRLRGFQGDPGPVVALLERLKDDPSRYVQRSVANNLNDIAKDHPEVAVEVCRRWSGNAPEGRAWIVRHALRSLVKQGDRGALEALGVGGPAQVRIEAGRLEPEQVRMGAEVRFGFEVVSRANRAQELVIDYAVHFVKANGQTRAKVFKLRRMDLGPGARVGLSGVVSLAEMTTRRHYAGRHRIEARINGAGYPVAEFEVLQPQTKKP